MPKTPKPPANSKPWYSIKALAPDTAEVLIYGDIGDSWLSESVTAKQFVEELQALADKKLIVRINSYGGSVSDGVAIYNAIKRHPMQKDVSIDGVAVSIASLIAMAGDTVSIAENGLLMVHAPWGGVIGNSAEVRKYADVLDKFADAMVTSYAAQTGKPADEMRALLTDGEDHWYTAQEAADDGFVDEIAPILDDAEAARFQPALFARFKIPAAVAAAFRKPTEVHAMTKEISPATEPAATPAAPEPTNVVAIEQAAEARALARMADRNKAIDAVFAKFMHVEGVSALHRACLTDTALTVQEASARLIAKLGEDSGPIAAAAIGRVAITEDEADKFRLSASHALMARAGAHRMAGNGVAALAIDLNGNMLRNASLLDIAKACLRRAGKNPEGMDKREIVGQAFQTTSDFPVLLENTMHKVLLQAYRTAPDTWSRFCKVGQVSDFRAHNRYRSGSLGVLLALNEHGEFKTITVPDGEKASITASTKGGIIRISRQVIVNDDLDSLMDMAMHAGRSAKRTIEADVYTLLGLNSGLGPTMGDTYTLFHANHSNITTGAAISMAAIDADRVAMASQKDVGGNDYLDLRPASLLLPIGLGGTARSINEAQYDPDTANKLQKPNTVRGLFRDVVDTPRLTGTRRYLFADPMDAPTIEVAFLDGQQEPFVEAKDGWGVDGAELKVREDFAVGAIEYRGAVTNAGA